MTTTTTTYTDEANLIDTLAEGVTAPIDYEERLEFLGSEIANDAVEDTSSEGAESVSDQTIATAHAYYSRFNTTTDE